MNLARDICRMSPPSVSHVSLIVTNSQKWFRNLFFKNTYACISCHWALFPYNLCSVETLEGILLQQMYLSENTTCSHECMGSWTFFHDSNVLLICVVLNASAFIWSTTHFNEIWLAGFNCIAVNKWVKFHSNKKATRVWSFSLTELWKTCLLPWKLHPYNKGWFSLLNCKKWREKDWNYLRCFRFSVLLKV